MLIRWAWQELRKPESVCFHLKSWVIDAISVCSPLASGSFVSPASQPPAPRKQPAPEAMLTLAAWVNSLLSVVSFWIQRTSCTYLYQHIHFKWVTTCSWKESKNSVGTENILYLCIASYCRNAEYSCWSSQQPWRKKLARIFILIGQLIVWRLRNPGNMCQTHQVDDWGSQDNGKGVENSKEKVWRILSYTMDHRVSKKTWPPCSLQHCSDEQKPGNSPVSLSTGPDYLSYYGTNNEILSSG